MEADLPTADITTWGEWDMHCQDDRHDDISEGTSLPYLEARDRDMYCQYSRRMVSCSSDRAEQS